MTSDYHKSKFFLCDCKTPSHLLQFYHETWDDHDNWDEFGCVLFLNHYLPWYKRLGIAVLYVLGYQTQHTHYDSWQLSRFDRVYLKEFLEDPKMAGREANIAEAVRTGIACMPAEDNTCKICSTGPCLGGPRY